MDQFDVNSEIFVQSKRHRFLLLKLELQIKWIHCTNPTHIGQPFVWYKTLGNVRCCHRPPVAMTRPWLFVTSRARPSWRSSQATAAGLRLIVQFGQITSRSYSIGKNHLKRHTSQLRFGFSKNNGRCKFKANNSKAFKSIATTTHWVVIGHAEVHHFSRISLFLRQQISKLQKVTTSKPRVEGMPKS